MKQLRNLDWEALAGITAAVIALVLHILHVVEGDALTAVVMVLLALILLRDLRRENRDEDESAAVSRMNEAISRLESAVVPPEVRLIGPRQLRSESERFARQAQGQMIWFNVCLLMFETQELFDVLLRPAIENPRVTSIQFLIDRSEQVRWETNIVPKASKCEGASKLRSPRLVDLKENISFILADDASGSAEAHVSFWGEPFMARQQGQDVPRFVLHVLPQSPLIARLEEMERVYRTARES